MQYRQSSRALMSTLAASLAAVVLFGGLASVFEPVAIAEAAPLLLAGPQSRGCASCGWIEAKRELLPLLADPLALRVYEYTLRMQDGSMSVFRETLPTSWHLGERVVLVE
jgi:hypothetical protein